MDKGEMKQRVTNRMIGATSEMNASDQLRRLLEKMLSVHGMASEAVRTRIDASVIRPLSSLVNLSTDPNLGGDSHEGEVNPRKLSDMLWELTEEATSLCNSVESVQLFEAAAALQDLVCRTAESEALAIERLNALRELIEDSPAVIKLSPNGPLLVKNVTRFLNWRYEPIPSRPLMARCRCGGSSMKPYCDGSHFEIKFQDAKDSRRVPDRRDTYVGQQVTILDNRVSGVKHSFRSTTIRFPDLV